MDKVYKHQEVEEDGDVAFHTDLVKVGISVENAEKIFMEAIEILKVEMPEHGENCEFCKWRESL